MAKFAQGVYKPTNAEKYVGTKPPIYRSSWELAFMRTMDSHPSIIEWASEPIKIPYVNPITGKPSVYVPDFLIRYMNSKKQIKVELIEVKPKSETFLEHAKSKKHKIALGINMVKWEAAHKWAKSRGLSFRVMNEDHIFVKTRK